MATMSRSQLFERIDAMLPGEYTVYHTGSLMHDRVQGPDFAFVHATATAAWSAMEAGKVKLSQRVLKKQIMVGYRLIQPTMLEYRATKCRPPYEPVVWSGPYATDKYSYKPPAKRVPVDKLRALTAAVTASISGATGAAI